MSVGASDALLVAKVVLGELMLQFGSHGLKHDLLEDI